MLSGSISSVGKAPGNTRAAGRRRLRGTSPRGDCRWESAGLAGRIQWSLEQAGACP